MKLTLLSLASLLLAVSALPTPNNEPTLSARQPHEIHQHHHHHHADGTEMTATEMDNMVKRHEIHEHHHHHHADGTEMTAAEMEKMNMKRGAHEGHLGEGMEEAREDVGDVYGKLW